MKRILLVTFTSNRADRSKTLRMFTDGLNKAGNNFDYALIQQIVFKVQKGKLHIMYKDRELHEAYDVIHLRNHDKYSDYANTIRLYCDAHDITLVNRTDSYLPYFGKLSQGALLALNGVPTPDLLTAYGNHELLQELTKRKWGYPLVIKHNEGIRGIDNYLVQNAKELQAALAQEKQAFIAQPFIPNSGELRVLTFGSALAPLLFQKTAADGTYLNNTFQGGVAKLVSADSVAPAMLTHAIQAAELMGRDIGGVDVLLATDGSYTILEVNSTPAIASGVYLDEKQKLYRQYFTDMEGDDNAR